jgi:tRNA (guanine37-N1)-methyltransferase
MSAGSSSRNTPSTAVEEVLKQIVPPELELVTSYEMVGHIAHMNLKEDILLYKHIIGQVILDVS